MTRLQVCLALAVSCLAAAELPQAEISNRAVSATLYLPDSQDGYYRATRFDWSGVVASLVWNGHSYFGKWFDRYDPKIHDAIMGPVEEFLTGNAGLGYAEAKAGENFVKIGVGALRKPDESGFQQFHTYEIADPGEWTIARLPDGIEFTQELAAVNGYAYLYRKRVRLRENPPGLVLEHSLKNKGRKTIETSVYEHDFFMLDAQPTSPDTVVTFPFEVRAGKSLAGLAETRAKQVVFLHELARGETVFTDLEGYGTAASDYDIRVENRKTGAGVRQTSDRPISKLVLWSIRATVCPEAYIDLKIEPGQESTWRISYEFYNVR
ncbi:MAG: hypothetical protein ABSH40_20185 [Bryobacteraceae bacterium]|jgi:hypothetical protein